MCVGVVVVVVVVVVVNSYSLLAPSRLEADPLKAIWTEKESSVSVFNSLCSIHISFYVLLPRGKSPESNLSRAKSHPGVAAAAIELKGCWGLRAIWEVFCYNLVQLDTWLHCGDHTVLSDDHSLVNHFTIETSRAYCQCQMAFLSLTLSYCHFHPFSYHGFYFKTLCILR